MDPEYQYEYSITVETKTVYAELAKNISPFAIKDETADQILRMIGLNPADLAAKPTKHLLWPPYYLKFTFKMPVPVKSDRDGKPRSITVMEGTFRNIYRICTEEPAPLNPKGAYVFETMGSKIFFTNTKAYYNLNKFAVVYPADGVSDPEECYDHDKIDHSVKVTINTTEGGFELEKELCAAINRHRLLEFVNNTQNYTTFVSMLYAMHPATILSLCANLCTITDVLRGNSLNIVRKIADVNFIEMCDKMHGYNGEVVGVFNREVKPLIPKNVFESYNAGAHYF